MNDFLDTVLLIGLHSPTQCTHGRATQRTPHKERQNDMRRKTQRQENTFKSRWHTPCECTYWRPCTICRKNFRASSSLSVPPNSKGRLRKITKYILQGRKPNKPRDTISDRSAPRDRYCMIIKIFVLLAKTSFTWTTLGCFNCFMIDISFFTWGPIFCRRTCCLSMIFIATFSLVSTFTASLTLPNVPFPSVAMSLYLTNTHVDIVGFPFESIHASFDTSRWIKKWRQWNLLPHAVHAFLMRHSWCLDYFWKTIFAGAHTMPVSKWMHGHRLINTGAVKCWPTIVRE